MMLANRFPLQFIGLLSIVAGLAVATLYAEPAIAATQIWFSPVQDDIDMGKPPGHRIEFTKFDYPTLLQANAPWRTAASRLAVLTVGLHTMSNYDDLPSVVAMTQRYNFKIATAGPMIATDGLCAMDGMEGLTHTKDFARDTVAAIRNWKMAGGRLDYIIMDSPLFFGYYASARSCHYAIADVARRAAATFREIQKLYPGIKVMDAEGPGPKIVDAWLPDLKEWLDDFKTQTNHPIDAVGMDLHWSDAWHTGYEWVSGARQIASFLHHQGIAAGLYIDADDKGVTNRRWLDLNREHMKLAAQSHIDLDFIYIASWMKFPDRNLPESDPDAYTSLINDAFTIFQGSHH